MHQSHWRQLTGVVGLCLLLALAGGCERQTATNGAAQTQKLTIYTSFYPTEYLLQEIGGSHVTVVNPCPADEDAAHWMPDQDTLADYAAADLIVINGANFEKWVEKVSLPESKLINVSTPLEERFIYLDERVTHSHGPGGEHSHEGVDGHTWVDPGNFMLQAGVITNALKDAAPQYAAAFDENYQELLAKFEKVEARLRTVSKHMHDRRILANHPAWNYLARAHDWKLKTFYIEPDELPSAETLAEITAYLAESPAEFILFEAPPSDAVAAALERLGLTPVVYEPIEALSTEERTAGRDYLTVLHENIDRLEAAFASAPAS